MTCRVAIIGLGMVARLHIQAVNSLSGFQVYGLFSRDESKTQDFAEKYAKDAKIFKQFDELCDDELLLGCCDSNAMLIASSGLLGAVL